MCAGVQYRWKRARKISLNVVPLARYLGLRQIKTYLFVSHNKTPLQKYLCGWSTMFGYSELGRKFIVWVNEVQRSLGVQRGEVGYTPPDFRQLLTIRWIDPYPCTLV